jgi:hypothetical protein
MKEKIMKRTHRLIAACAGYMLFVSVVGWTHHKNTKAVGAQDEMVQYNGYSNDPTPDPSPPPPLPPPKD